MSSLGLERYLLDDEPAQWVRGFVRRLAAGRVIPTYGSRDWQTAPWELQVAAVTLAGEAHRREALFLEQKVADELAAARYWQEVDEADAFAEQAARVRALVNEPTHSELVRRRAEVA